MKKLALGAIAALVATVALTSGAEAGGWKWHNHGWNNGWHHGFWGGPRVVIRPVYYHNYCFVKNVHEYDEFGNLYIRRVRVCN